MLMLITFPQRCNIWLNILKLYNTLLINMWDFTLFKIDLIDFFTLITHITLIIFLQTTNIWTFIKLLSQLTLMFNLVMKKIWPLIQFFCIKRFVNSLMFLQINSWPNISYTIKIIGNCSNKPKHFHCNAINQILKYFKSTRNLAICYNGYMSQNIFTTYCNFKLHNKYYRLQISKSKLVLDDFESWPSSLGQPQTRL
jgi:hypothetical protein